MKTITKCLGVGIAAMCLYAANAADYSLKYQGITDSQTVTINRGNGSAPWQTVYAGLMNFTVLSGPLDDPLSPSPFQTFCTDAGVNLNTGTYNYERMTFTDAQDLAANGALGGITPAWFNHPYGINLAGWIYNQVLAGTWTYTPNLYAAAQVAIWEVLYDGDGAGYALDRASGNFRVANKNATFDALVDQILSDASSASVSEVTKWVLVPYSGTSTRTYGGSQELLSLPTGDTPPVPDGGMTLALLGLALGALGFLRRK